MFLAHTGADAIARQLVFEVGAQRLLEGPPIAPGVAEDFFAAEVDKAFVAAGPPRSRRRASALGKWFSGRRPRR